MLALQRMLGHEKASVTLDVYADLYDEDLDVLAEQLATARSENLADSPGLGRSGMTSESPWLRAKKWSHPRDSNP